MAAGALALGVVAALAVLGVAPDGGHIWHSIQTAIGSSVDKISPSGGHIWHR